ncbi:MAG: hypothetical protein VYA34_08765, partial [Myxococcota bacterium]|nr:hypothetical protein [Myxococcota bacterium]
NDKRQTTNDKRQTTNDKRQTTNDKRQTTNDTRQTTNGMYDLNHRILEAGRVQACLEKAQSSSDSTLGLFELSHILRKPSYTPK